MKATGWSSTPTAERSRFARPSKRSRSDEGTGVGHTTYRATTAREEAGRTPPASGPSALLFDLVRSRSPAAAGDRTDVALEPVRAADSIQRIQVAGTGQPGRRGDS